jgi:hypothetical protein
MKKELIGALVWAVGMLALAVGATFAHRLGYIDRDTVTRLVTGVIGLWMAWFGNRIPKTFTRSAQARQIQRVAAWSQVLSGLTYAGLWAFAPIPVAVTVGTGVVLAGIAVTFGYCLLQTTKAKAA